MDVFSTVCILGWAAGYTVIDNVGVVLGGVGVDGDGAARTAVSEDGWVSMGVGGLVDPCGGCFVGVVT